MSSRYLFAVIVLIFTTVYAYADSQDELEYKPGELIVRFKKDKDKPKTIKEKQALIDKRGGGKIKKSYKRLSDLHVVELPKNLKVKDALKKYKDSKDILYAEPNYKIYPLSTFPNDPNFSQLWGLHNTGQEYPLEAGGFYYGIEDADIDAPEAWDIYTGNQNIVVAVIDTGVNYAHPDLSANMWVNQAELIGDPNSDDDNNGYIDDIYGYDFINEDSDPNDDNFHGTHVAGTIGAVGNNNAGITGVCWSVKIMSLKFLDEYGSGDIYGWVGDAIAAINYAVDNGAKVLNNSWGGGPSTYSSSLKDAIEDAETAGVLFIVAAGNDAYNNEWEHAYPSDYDCDNIISVLATNSTDEKAGFSNYGTVSVDIGAPGEDIFSTFPTYRTGAYSGLEIWYGRTFSTHYETIGGTSMATPHVSGACALVWSMYPHLKMSEVRQIVLDSADPLDSLDGLCVTEGRLNLYQALLRAHPLEIEIEDNIADPNGSVVPEDEITFTITYGNPSPTNSSDPNYFGDADNTIITFEPPAAIEPNHFHPNYNLTEGKYTWNIGTLYPGDSNSITFTVTVNENAEPIGTIKSKVKMTSSIGYGEDQEETRVGHWGGDRIYVDAYATGHETGTSWNNAYTDLQDAMERAEKSRDVYEINEIWVAQGIYRPSKTQNPNASFDMIDGLKLYGGFGTDANSLNDRDFVRYKTYLSGNIDIGGDLDSFIVVDTTTDPNFASITSDTVLDGFIITHAAEAAVYCNEADLIIQNNTIVYNQRYGMTETPGKHRNPQNTLAQDKANVLSDRTPCFLCRFRRFLPNFEKFFTFFEKIQILPSSFRVPIRSI